MQCRAAAASTRRSTRSPNFDAHVHSSTSLFLKVFHDSIVSCHPFSYERTSFISFREGQASKQVFRHFSMGLPSDITTTAIVLRNGRASLFRLQCKEVLWVGSSQT